MSNSWRDHFQTYCKQRTEDHGHITVLKLWTNITTDELHVHNPTSLLACILKPCLAGNALPIPLNWLHMSFKDFCGWHTTYKFLQLPICNYSIWMHGYCPMFNTGCPQNRQTEVTKCFDTQGGLTPGFTILTFVSEFEWTLAFTQNKFQEGAKRDTSFCSSMTFENTG